MSGFSTWPIRDILILIIVIFNAGGLVYLTKNHIKHMNETVLEILNRLRSLEQKVSNIEGRLSKE